MSSGHPEIKPGLEEIEVQTRDEKHLDEPQIVMDKEMFTDAIQGENREHAMTMWEAVNTYPMACIWAFVMAFTIVSEDPAIGGYAAF